MNINKTFTFFTITLTILSLYLVGCEKVEPCKIGIIAGGKDCDMSDMSNRIIQHIDKLRSTHDNFSNIEFVILDSKGSIENTIIYARKLVEVDHVQTVLIANPDIMSPSIFNIMRRSGTPLLYNSGGRSELIRKGEGWQIDLNIIMDASTNMEFIEYAAEISADAIQKAGNDKARIRKLLWQSVNVNNGTEKTVKE